MSFCLDTNVFIQAERVRYPLDFAPGFWDQLLVAARAGKLFSIDEVFLELQQAKDDLADWAEQHRDVLFRDNSDSATQQALLDVDAAIARRLPAYTDAAKQEFLNGADPWLIAYCLAHGHELVTEERGDPKQRSKVRIPDVCELVGVQTLPMLSMLRKLQFRLVAG